MSQDTPRAASGDPFPATLSPYASSATSSDFGSEYAYSQQETGQVNELTDRFAETTIDSQGKPSTARSISYGDPSSEQPATGQGKNPFLISDSHHRVELTKTLMQQSIALNRPFRHTLFHHQQPIMVILHTPRPLLLQVTWEITKECQ